MARYLLKEHDDAEAARKRVSRNPLVRFQLAFESGFDEFAPRLSPAAHAVRGSRRRLSDSLLVFAVGSVLLLTPSLGQDFFPSVDAGQFKIHVRARTGTRIEETALLCDHIDSTIREQIPANELVTIVDNIGLPYSGSESLLLHLRAHRPGRRRHPGAAERRSPPHRGLRREVARRAGAASIPASLFTCCRWTS